MKANPKYAFVAMVAVVAMTACGGSADDGAGQLSEFQVSPDTVEIQSATVACPSIKAGDYLIVGGTAPYTAFSPYHQLITFGPAGAAASSAVGTYTIPNRNNQFSIFVEGCFDPGTVTVLDDLKRVAVIEVSYSASGAN